MVGIFLKIIWHIALLVWGISIFEWFKVARVKQKTYVHHEKMSFWTILVLVSALVMLLTSYILKEGVIV